LDLLLLEQHAEFAVEVAELLEVLVDAREPDVGRPGRGRLKRILNLSDPTTGDGGSGALTRRYEEEARL
jgi:hypothetical protein